ncbi:MAG: hypothetical protein AB2A00_05420 [Myxococcota bacterium]
MRWMRTGMTVVLTTLALAGAGATLSCTTCDEDEVREGNRCVRLCNADADCGVGRICVEGHCLEGQREVSDGGVTTSSSSSTSRGASSASAAASSSTTSSSSSSAATSSSSSASSSSAGSTTSTASSGGLPDAGASSSSSTSSSSSSGECGGWVPHDDGGTSVVGCADGTREAFVGRARFPGVAGCGAQWDSMSLRAPRSGVACGNDFGGFCNAPADACAVGWHVCGNAPQGRCDVSLRVTAEQCANQTGAFVSALGDLSCEECSPGSGAVCCGDGCVQQNGDCVWPDATPWYGVINGHINTCGDIEQIWTAETRGVMCCRD